MPGASRATIHAQLQLMQGKEQHVEVQDDDEFSMDPEFLRAHAQSSKEAASRQASKQSQYEEQVTQYWHLSDADVLQGVTMLVNVNFRDWIQHPLHTDDLRTVAQMKEDNQAAKAEAQASGTSGAEGVSSSSSDEEQTDTERRGSATSLDLFLGSSSDEAYTDLDIFPPGIGSSSDE